VLKKSSYARDYKRDILLYYFKHATNLLVTLPITAFRDALPDFNDATRHEEAGVT